MTNINASNEGARPDRVRAPDTAARSKDRERDATELTDERTREILRVVADKAFENPPKDFLQLNASATKLMLTDLEPAMAIARAVREQALQGGAARDLQESLASERRQEALVLLTDPAREETPRTAQEGDPPSDATAST